MSSRLTVVLVLGLVATLLFFAGCKESYEAPPPNPTWAQTVSANTFRNVAAPIEIHRRNENPRGLTDRLVTLGEPASGTAEIAANQEVIYTPAEGFVGADAFAYEVRDEEGFHDVGLIVVDVRTMPDPEATAPETDESEPSGVGDAIGHRLEGDNPTQAGIEEGAFDEERVALIGGRVLDREGNPVPEVTVRVLGEPQLGFTATRDSGHFEIVVNGGGEVTLSLFKDGYFGVQRRREVGWQEVVVLPDIVMVSPDPVSTEIEPVPAHSSMHESSTVSDDRGSRSSSVMFPTGLGASVIVDGEAVPIDESYEVRTTELSVGEHGPSAVPADLPPHLSYSYTVAAGVDDTPMGSSVEFTEPVPFYVPNFLNYPVGASLNLGSLETQQGEWVTLEEPVRVLRMLGTSGGRAELDVDGSGAPAAPAQYAGLSITEEEREEIAQQFDVDDTFLRARMPHFSFYTFGAPVRAKDPDAPRPQVSRPRVELGEPGPDTLETSLELAGTGERLHYNSARMLGYTRSRTFDVEVVGGQIPQDLEGVVVQIAVAGRLETIELDAGQLTPNHRVEWTWDGFNIDNRRVYGVQNATVTVAHLFPGEFLDAQTGEPIGNSLEPVELTREFTVQVGGFDPRGTLSGGWTMSDHHRLDPQGMLFLGDGRRRALTETEDVGDPGNFHAEIFSGDEAIEGATAVEVPFNYPSFVSVQPGSGGSTFVVTDYSTSSIRRVDEGEVSVVAGDGSFAFGGDGGDATAASLFAPLAAVIAPDGSVYISDTGNSRIRRVDPGGTITTIAGTGSDGFSGDGGPAEQAQLFHPSGIHLDQANNRLLIADTRNHRVRAVDLNSGTISTIAGSGTGFDANSVPRAASEVNLSAPGGVTTLSDGTVIFSDTFNNRVLWLDGTTVRRVRGFDFPVGLSVDPATDTLFVAEADPREGRLWKVPNPTGSSPSRHLIAGGSGQLSPEASGADAAATDMYPVGVSHAGGDYVLVADNFANRVRRINTDTLAFTTVAGNGRAQTRPSDLAVRPDGEVLFPDRVDYRLYRTEKNDERRAVRLAGTGIAAAFEAGAFEERPQYIPIFGAFGGDGDDALRARMKGPTGVARTSSGRVFVADRENHRVRMIDTDGRIHTIAGDGTRGTGSMQLDHPTDVLLRGGSLYVADSRNHRVLEFDIAGLAVPSQGTFSQPLTPVGTFGQSGVSGDNTDDVPLGQATFRRPTRLARRPGNGFFIADGGSHRVLEVDLQTNRVRRIAGTGSGGYSGDGGPAHLARLRAPRGMVFHNNALFIADSGNHRIRVVTFAGDSTLIRTFMGSGDTNGPGEGALLGVALDSPAALAVSPQGHLLVGDTDNFRVLRVRSATESEADEILVTSVDGTEVYEFDRQSGRHLRTLHALTGELIREFEYTEGRLTTVRLRDGTDHLLLAYDSNDRLQSISTAAGATTDLGVDANANLLLTVGYNGNPVRTNLVYDGAGGLLTDIQDTVRSTTARFNYRPSGSLSEIIDRNDERTEFFRQSLPPAGDREAGFRVDYTGPSPGTMGDRIEWQFRREYLRTPTRTRETWEVFGQTTVVERELVAGGQMVVRLTRPGGETVVETLLRDERLPFHWRLLERSIQAQGTTSPDYVEEYSRTLAWDGADPFSLTEQLDLVTIDGNVHEQRFTAPDTLEYLSPEGRAIELRFDANARVDEVVGRHGTPVTVDYTNEHGLASLLHGARNAEFTYDVRGYLDSLENAEQDAISFDVDDIGRATRVGLPFNAGTFNIPITPPENDASGIGRVTIDGEDWQIALTLVDQLFQFAGPSTPVIQFSYRNDGLLDAINRTAVPPISLSFDYDSAGRLTEAVDTVSGTYLFGYDAAGRLASVEETGIGGGQQLEFAWTGDRLSSASFTGAAAGTLLFDYEPATRRLASTNVAGATATYDYDDDGLLSGMTLFAGSLSINRDPASGEIDTSTLGSARTVHSYNAFGEPAGIVAEEIGGPVRFEVSNVTSNALGQITGATVTDEGSVSYSYDSRGQLTSGPGVSLAYDENGNLTTIRGDTATYSAADEIQTLDAFEFSHDDAGRRVSLQLGSDELFYAYDAREQLVSVSDLATSDTTEFVYDGLGRITRVIVNSAVLRGYLWDDQSRLVAELDGNNDVIARFFYIGDASRPAVMVRGSTAYRLVWDHAHNLRAVIDTTDGSLAQRIDYDVLGRVTTDTNPGFTPFGFKGGLRLEGSAYSAEFNLVAFTEQHIETRPDAKRLGATRVYDPHTGRFLTRHPLGFEGLSSNLYSFANNDFVGGDEPAGFGEPTLAPTGRSEVDGPLAEGRLLERFVPRAWLDGAMRDTLGRLRPSLWGSREAARSEFAEAPAPPQQFPSLLPRGY